MALALTDLATTHPKTFTATMLLVTLGLALLAGVPTLWPEATPHLFAAQVDTDPENMLRADETVRVVTDRMKAALSLHDIIVVGVVNDEHPDGVFNAESLGKIYELTEYARRLRGEGIGVGDPAAGVVEVDLIAPSTVDNIEQAGPGSVRFEWLMPGPPEDAAAALAIREKARRLPFLEGTLISENGKAIGLYLPLTSKDVSHRVYTRLRDRIAGFEGSERYFITGLPVAEDTFGVEMFLQMAISAPLAMIAIFLLMLFFFRKLVLVISPMIVALVSVIVTMALLVATGNTIHIMSSLIPIFIMPIAVLDSIHIISDFFDRYQGIKDRRETIRVVMKDLFRPMLYTSLTSAAGFASLALTPIPPVQVFGIFVAIGVLLAWFLTITFIPAYVMFIPETSLADFGLRHDSSGESRKGIAAVLDRVGRWTIARPRMILFGAALMVVAAVFGIGRIEINDNPTRWFRASHPIRVADRVLNEHFGGTYMAYLALTPDGELPSVPEASSADVGSAVDGLEPPELPAGLGGETPAVREIDVAGPAAEELFKQPEALRYVESLQEHLLTTGVVGKSNSVADIVKMVHRELVDGRAEEFRVPDSAAAVAQTLVQYQSSHRPDDLWHFVTPDYRNASIWLQLKSGDNKDMEAVIAATDLFLAENPPPLGLEAQWFGLTYINVVWQQKMVSGMFRAFAGSFLVVFLMMTLLFRSPLWGLLSMIPLTLTIALIYGVIGIVGKDYDMPVAVLSSLTLGLAVDFAIHLLARARELYRQHRSWEATCRHVFGEPARAITRNVIVIAIGFTPLLAAPLVPYNTVGTLLAGILLTSGVATLFILPAILGIFESRLFRKERATGA